MENKNRASKVKIIIMDVDGTLTDGTLLILPDGEELKSYNVKDGLGILLAHLAGLKTGIITGKVSKALEKKYDCEKTYLLSIGDMVEHIHFHLIPKHRDKCSMGVYCFGKLFEVEGERKPSDSDLNALANEIKGIIENS